MKHDLPNETAAAGAHIGSEIWMVKWPPQAKAVGLPSVVTFDREEAGDGIPHLQRRWWRKRWKRQSLSPAL